MNFTEGRFPMKYLLITVTALIMFGLGVLLGYAIQKSSHSNVERKDIIIDSITYHNENENAKIRYKYITSYETVENDLAEKVLDKPIYSLYVDDVIVSEAYPLHKNNIPTVSDMFKMKKGQELNLPFRVELNGNVDRYKIRIDVRIVIEELMGGKWAPVYQVIFMERGPYWSLNKGPIEKLEE